MITDDLLSRAVRPRAACFTVVDRTVTLPPDRTPWLAAGLIGFACLLHLAYLFVCPFDLAPDEAHYWHWSRHLDSAYYSKGPLIAWLIRGSCELFGQLSVELTGTEVLAVRFPAIACHAILLAGTYVLCAESFRNRRLALAVVALALTMPPLTAGAVIMTIDAPYLACWVWSLVFIRRAVTENRLKHWVFAGIGCGLGLLAKFPTLLLPAALVLYLLANRERRWLLRTPGPWVTFAIVAVASVPIMEWNLRHGWLEARHVFRQVSGAGANATAPLAFLGGQFGFLLGYWFLAFVAAAWTFRPRLPFSREAESSEPSAGGADTSDVKPSALVIIVRRARAAALGSEDSASRLNKCGITFLWYFSVPAWLVFLFASTRTAGQVNWPAAAYVAGFPLTVAWVHRQITDRTRWYRRFAKCCLGLGIVLGVVVTLAAHFPGTFMRPVLALVASPPTQQNPTPLRKLDPTCRLVGWRTLAAKVDAIRERIRGETGRDAVLAGMVWTTPGELAFYCDGHPEAYSLGLALADRHSQYDVWRPNPVADAQVFHGRTFVYVGDEIPGMTDVFDRVEPPIRVEYAEDGHVLAAWTIWVGHGFRGFREVSHRGGY